MSLRWCESPGNAARIAALSADQAPTAIIGCPHMESRYSIKLRECRQLAIAHSNEFKMPDRLRELGFALEHRLDTEAMFRWEPKPLEQ
jgi:hypothetical protein